jgi:hypothetical protein
VAGSAERGSFTEANARAAARNSSPAAFNAGSDCAEDPGFAVASNDAEPPVASWAETATGSAAEIVTMRAKPRRVNFIRRY